MTTANWGLSPGRSAIRPGRPTKPAAGIRRQTSELDRAGEQEAMINPQSLVVSYPVE